MSYPIERLTEAVAAVAPIHGCAIIESGTVVPPDWHTIINSGTSYIVRIDYKPEATAGQISAGDNTAIAFNLNEGVKRPRLIYDVYNDVNALTATQKTNIWNDLSQGVPPKWATDRGINAADLHILWLLATQLGAVQTVTDKRICQTLLISIYVTDNPNYLVNPPFDSTINVPGDELAP